MPRPLIKICGLSTPATLAAALGSGADWVGLVFFPKSPRNVSIAQAASLASQARGRAEIVVLTVDATQDALDEIVQQVRPDRLQLHGRETPERVASLKRTFGLPVIKAIGVSQAEDLLHADPFLGVSDTILFDAKAPKGAALPGGNGIPFDWTIARGARGPFMLSGGLYAGNVRQALDISGATAVDVSSGVETAPGLKDADLIAAFIKAARKT